ncbi:uncharacterized protein LOC128552263 [Mercenaria mercenaria]|uniref:uncharacterized protein LOC128552263 n=1 Tax=Mercenaria mercenaria TaxID=6596 RepID=UPI00234F3BED|nr:uncharacterized protein LOC128552263 [Mercenaria mercenaria]
MKYNITLLKGQKDRPRMSSKDEKATLALRRQICMQENILDEVKQVFVKETKSSDKTGYNKKHLELCTPYLLKCAEICWSMVIHDPPLYIKFDAKAGDKLDLNFYTVYASTGEKIDFLVWPPLFNEEKGGLLSKGVAEPLKIIKK